MAYRVIYFLVYQQVKRLENESQESTLNLKSELHLEPSQQTGGEHFADRDVASLNWDLFFLILEAKNPLSFWKMFLL